MKSLKNWMLNGSILLLSIAQINCTNRIEQKEEIGQSEIQKQISTYLAAHANNGNFNGAVLIAKSDSILFTEAYGYANRTFEIPNTEKTKYLIGSVTKPFTAYAILLLEKDQKLALEDNIDRYFPNFPNAKNISIYHLLTHTSGIKDYHQFSDWRMESKLDLTPMETIEKVAKDPVDFAPGERFRYSNTGYIMLGLIVEQLSGKTFEKYIQQALLEPMGLINTGVASNSTIVTGLASGYSTDFKRIEKAEYIHYNQPFTSGNMYSTVEDLWKFTRAVMDNSLLDSAKTSEIFNHNTGKYGYGWGIRKSDDGIYYGHHGGMNGFIGSMSYLPKDEVFICFLTNDDNTPKYTITDDLIAILRNQKVEPPKSMKLKSLSDQDLQKVIGKYMVRPGDTLDVFQEGNILFLQETERMKHELFPIGEDEFAFKLFEFNAKFSSLEMDKYQQLDFVGRSAVKAKRVDIKQ